MSVVNVHGLGIDERVMAIDDDQMRASFLELLTGPPPVVAAGTPSLALPAVPAAVGSAVAPGSNAVGGSNSSVSSSSGVGRWEPSKVGGYNSFRYYKVSVPVLL